MSWREAARTRLRNATPTVVRCAVDWVRGGDRRHRANSWMQGRRIARSLVDQLARGESSERRRNVCVIGLVEHAGDMVAAEPVARHLRQQHPDDKLIWVCRGPFRELVEHHPAIDEVIEVDCLTSWISLSSQYDGEHLYDLHIVGRCCPRCGWRVEKTGDAGQVALANYYRQGPLLQAFCRTAGLTILDESPELHVPHDVARSVDALALPERFIVIHGQSNQPQRDWDAAHWRQFVEQLVADGHAVVEIGGQAVVGSAAPGYTNLCGKLSWLQSAQVIRRAELFVGIDSGPAHLAHAMRTFGVILLGKFGTFERYCPYSGRWGRGEGVELIQHDGPASTIPVQRALDAVHEALRRRDGIAGRKVSAT